MKLKLWTALGLAALAAVILAGAAAVSDEGLPVSAENFPDKGFRSYVSEFIDTDHSGFLTADEIAAVTDISIKKDYGLCSVQGIGFFTEMTALVIDGNPGLTGIDLRCNTKLKYAEVRNNGLTELLLDGLRELKELICYGNPGMAELDLRGCPILLDAALNGTKSEPDWGDLYSGGPMGGTLFTDAGIRLIFPGPACTLNLPAMLTEIEDGAFSGIAAETVVIPETVTDISGNPFEGSRVTVICGSPDSAAQTLAETYGYTFVMIDDDGR